MPKSILSRFINSKQFKQRLPNYTLTTEQESEFLLFSSSIGYTSDRINFLIQCVNLDYYDWPSKWNELKACKQHSLNYFQIYYGNKEGLQKYNQNVKLKTTKGFPNTLNYWLQRGFSKESARQEIKKYQSSLNAKAVQVILAKEQDRRTCRQLGFWEMRGHSLEEAKRRVKEIQTTNGIEHLRHKFSNLSSEGISTLQLERNKKWQQSLRDNPKNVDIGQKRCHSLARYIARSQGNEEKGLQNYLKYRSLVGMFGRASKESLLFFMPIIKFLEKRNIRYNIGEKDSKELSLYDKDLKKVYWYDLFIPNYNLIIEYNGEAWHPNPQWNAEKWLQWSHPYSKENADSCHRYYQRKIAVAMLNNYQVFQVYSSEDRPTVYSIILRKLNGH